MSEENGIAIPTGWFKARASEVCEKIQDGTHFSPKAQLSAGQYPYVTAKNVRPSGLDLRDITYLSEQDHREIYARCDCRRGDVLLVKDGVNTGDAAINSFDGEISLLSSVCMLRPKAEVLDAGFLRYYLQSPQCTPFLLGGMTGTAIRRIILKRIKALPVLACAIPEQRRIVAAIESHFSRLDAATATLERAQRNLERYRASVLKAAVEGRLVPTEAELAKKEGRTYEPASTLLKRILTERRRRWEEAELAKLTAKGKKPTDDKWKAKYEEPAAPDVSGLPELPEGWCWASVDQLTAGDRMSAYGVLVPGPDVADGVLFVRVGDIDEGRIDQTGLKRIERQVADQFRKTYLRGGEVLLTLVGTIGRAAVVPESLAGANVARAVGVIPPCSLVSPSWLVTWLRSPMTRARMVGKSHEVARKTLNLEDVRTAPVALPPHAEHGRIVEVVSDLDSLAGSAETSLRLGLQRIARLRHSILKWAFEGRLTESSASIPVKRATGTT